MAKRVLLCVNARARRGSEARDRVAAAMRARGHTVTVVELRERDDLSRAIRERREQTDIVAVAGGDGTLLGAIEGLRETGLPLLPLPLGTINELARTLAIPADLARAAALVDDGHEHAIDVGCVNGFWYFDEGSIGLSTRVARLQTGPVKSRWGMLAIPIATLRALRYLHPFQVEIETAEGERRQLRAMQITVANSRRFGGVVENPEARMDDGLLELYAIDVENWRHATLIVLAVAVRRLHRTHGVVALRSARFTVRTRRPRSIYADGEPASSTPAEFTIVREAVRVIGTAAAVAAIG